MEMMSQLEGAFALLIKSTHFPDELVAAKKGSPLLLGAPPSSHECTPRDLCCFSLLHTL